MRSDDQQLPQIAIAHLGDPPEPGLAGCAEPQASIPTRQGGNEPKKGKTSRRRSALATITLPPASTAWTWKTCLARSTLTVVTHDRSAVSLLMWMALPWWIFDNHTVEVRHSRIKPSTERRPHHHRNSVRKVCFLTAAFSRLDRGGPTRPPDRAGNRPPPGTRPRDSRPILSGWWWSWTVAKLTRRAPITSAVATGQLRGCSSKVSDKVGSHRPHRWPRPRGHVSNGEAAIVEATQPLGALLAPKTAPESRYQCRLSR